MSHPQQVEFCKKVKNTFPEFFCHQLVLDIGSLDINGNNRYLFDNCTYLGIDIASGNNVDIVANGSLLQLPDESIDVIISTECLEHDMFYAATLENIYRMLKPGGLFLMTCATEGRPEHGTARTTPQDAPLLQGNPEWKNYYKNITEYDFRKILHIERLFKQFAFEVNHVTHDLYFYGFKTGDLPEKKNKYYSANKLDEIINQHEKILQEKDEAYAAVNAQLVKLNTQIVEKDAALAEIAACLIERDASITRINSDIAAKCAVIAAMNADIAEKEIVLAAKEAAIAEKNNTIAETNTAVALKGRALAETQIELTAIKTALIESELRLADATSKMQALLNSHSWRYSKLFRVLGQVIRSVRRKALCG